MFVNYLKIALRNISRNKLYSMINIVGLAIGMAACLVIFLWVQDELSFDRFHSQADRIFRVERKIDFRDSHGQAPITAGAYGPALVKDYPEIEKFVRVDKQEINIRDHRNIFRKQELLFADNSLFEIFDFRLEQGDPKSALVEPKTIVMTRKAALRLLNTAEVVGKTVSLDWNGTLTDFQITGILQDIPYNSHISFEIAASISSYPEEQMIQFLSNFLFTYVLIGKNTSLSDLEPKFEAFLTRYMAADFLAVLGPEINVNDVFQLKMKPLKEIHLYPSIEFEIEPQGSITSVYIFSAIALLILAVACVNFMNLSTARANKRAREVGLRKTIGAQKQQLWRQFLGESVLLAFLALALALLFILLMIPAFNNISGKHLTLGALFQSGNWWVLIGITLITGCLSGLYPAFFLTAFAPADVLKGGALKGTGRSIFRRSMAVVQFVISIALIIGTLVIYRQMEFIQNKSLGFDKENVLVIQAAGNPIQQNIEAFRSTLTEYSGIKAASVSSNIPGSSVFSDTVFKRSDSDEVFDLIFIRTDYEFVSTLGFNVIQGRNFSKDFSTDIESALMINQAAVQKMGYTPEEAVGKKLLRYASATEMIEGTIIGVMENFNFKSLRRDIEPCVLMLEPDNFRVLSVRIQPGEIPKTIGFIQEQWSEFFPGEEFNYRFLDQYIDLLYQKEGKVRSLLVLFSSLSIFVASLGLFGLASFTAEEKTKEIGVRKVMGASSSRIFWLLCKEFAKWVLAANIIAWPLAYYAMSRWLQNFAYKISIGIGPFVLSAVLALLIALFTVSFQSFKAALADPAASLRYE